MAPPSATVVVATDVRKGLSEIASVATGKEAQTCRFGWLLGATGEPAKAGCRVLALLRAPDSLTDLNPGAATSALSEASPLLPAGVGVVGVFAAGTGASTSAPQSVVLSPNQGRDQLLVAFAEVEEGSGETTVSFWWFRDGELADADVSEEAEPLSAEFVTVHCQLPVHCHLMEATGLSWKQQVDAAVEKLKERLSGSRPTFFFKAKGTAAVEEPGASSKGKKGGGGGRGGGRAGASVKQQQPMGCVMQLGRSSADGCLGDLAADGTELLEAVVMSEAAAVEPASGGEAPSVCYQPLKEGLQLRLKPVGMHLDLLALVPRSAPLQSVTAGYLLPGLLAQLCACGEVLRQNDGAERAKVYLFQLEGLPFMVGIPYCLPKAGDSSAALCEQIDRDNHDARKRFHSSLGLPMDRPLLRVANSWKPDAGTSASAQPTSARLADVHIGLPPSGVKGTVTTIWGSYDYYHYMQDRFDDSGWGCAYRSLQTIMSWFRKQHYTSKPVLSHREIQQMLVDMGDKSKSFVGSREWIGAIELSYILDNHMGVTCKVMTVSTGAEMPSKAREIAQHFERQGTPIMVGGGVLAYTLLGIDYNERTGDCAFLILDPHYTGGEDLQRIHGGTWVWWKKPVDKAAAGGELFVKDAFYNLLCPQRPTQI